MWVVAAVGSSGSKISKEQSQEYEKKFGVSKDEIKKLHKVWLSYAKKDDKANMDLAGFKNFCKDVGSDDGNIPKIFSYIDASADGLIQFEEWIVFVLKAKNPSYEDYAQLVIDLYDEDGSGTVSVAEVRKLALSKAKVEGVLTPERQAEIENVIKSIFAFADTNGDGELSKEELIAAAEADPAFAQTL